MSVKRTYTIAEASELTGLSRKALARRIERGSLRSLVRNGRRLIPRSELVRAGLVREEGADPAPAPAGSGAVVEGTEGPSAEAMLTALMRELLDRLERQGNEIASYRAITAQAESLHLEREIGELRARLSALEGNPPGTPGTPAPRTDETVRLAGAVPPPAPSGEGPIWLPASAAEQPSPHPVPQPAAPPTTQPQVYPRRAPHPFAGRVVVLLLEAAFIVAVAVAAWYAELRPAAIVGTIGVAWLLVALLEWMRWGARGGPR